jgi:hypothetical protein
MKRALLSLIVVALLVIGFGLLHRSRSRSNINVDPHAREEIEKALRR